MTEETKLSQHFGKKEPFKVPEGYFDTFADRLQARIAQLPKEEKKPAKHILFVPKAWFAAAASVVIVASVGLSLMIPKWNEGQTELATATENNSLTETNAPTADEDYYFDELDYAMIGNREIAYYLMEY